jgi:hypothetical protein
MSEFHAEVAAVKQIIDRALALGWAVSVNDGEETTLSKSRVRKDIVAAIATTDEDILTFSHNNKRIGSIYIVWGNGAEDVVCDCTDKVEILELIAGDKQSNLGASDPEPEYTYCGAPIAERGI